MARVLIVGGGFGGVVAAESLAKKLGSDHEITLVSRSRKFLFYPALPRGIKKAPKAGGEATFVYENPTEWPTVGLISDAENFYYAQMNDKGYSALMKLAKKGGAPAQIAPAINHTFEFAVDEANVYYFDNEPGGGMIGTVALRKASKDGGEPVMLDHGRAGWVKYIAVDKTQIYFTDIANVYALTK